MVSCLFFKRPRVCVCVATTRSSVSSRTGETGRFEDPTWRTPPSSKTFRVAIVSQRRFHMERLKATARISSLWFSSLSDQLIAWWLHFLLCTTCSIQIRSCSWSNPIIIAFCLKCKYRQAVITDLCLRLMAASAWFENCRLPVYLWSSFDRYESFLEHSRTDCRLRDEGSVQTTVIRSNYT